MKEIQSFMIGGFGEIYILYKDGTMIHGELENLPLEEGETVEKVKVNIIKQIILPEWR